MKDHTRKIKMFFSVIVLFLGVVMIYGSFLVYGITPKAKNIFLGFYHFAEYSFSFESKNILLASVNNFSNPYEKKRWSN